MQYVICYDIADDRRRERISQALLDFGPKIQESVHWALLDDETAGRMLQRIKELIDEIADRVHVFPLCEACGRKVVIAGNAERPSVADFYVI